MVKNLNTVLDTTVKHQQQFDETIKNFEKLVTGLKNHADPIAAAVANISNAAGTIADLLADNRAAAAKNGQLPREHPAAARRSEGPTQRLFTRFRPR